MVRFRYKNGDLKATGQPERIVEGIPWVHHWTRDIVVAPDGNRFYFSVGSGSNVAQDMFPAPQLTVHPAPRIVTTVAEWAKIKPLGAAWDTEEFRANVLSFDPNGKNISIVATGLRNCAGITIQPITAQLWCVTNERDSLGESQPSRPAASAITGTSRCRLCCSASIMASMNT